MEVARVIPATASTLWELLARPHRWPEWGPSVRAVEYNDVEVRAGTRGRIRTPIGLWLPFTITAVEPKRAWHWRVAGITGTGHRIEPVDARHTRIVFEIPAWGFPYGIVGHVALQNLSRRATKVSPDRRGVVGGHDWTGPQTNLERGEEDAP